MFHPVFLIQFQLRQRIQLFARINQAPLLIWLTWRLVFLLLPLLVLAFSPALSVKLNPFISNDWVERVFGSWVRWDGMWYLTIAREGYSSSETAAFFPLYPWLISLGGAILAWLLPPYDALAVAAVLISSALVCLSYAMLYRLARLDYDENNSRLTVLYIASFPTAFFFYAVYTEALFLVLATGAFLAARHNRWWWAVVLASLAILTKNQGIVVVFSLIIEYIVYNRDKTHRVLGKLTLLALPFSTLAAWLLYNLYVFNNPFQFILSNQIYWQRYFTLPWDTVSRAIGKLFQSREASELLVADRTQNILNYVDYLITTGFIILACLGVRAALKHQLRWSYLAYFLGILAVSFSSPSLEQPLYAFSRYVIIIFPAYFLLARLGYSRRWFHFLYLLVSIPLSLYLATHFILWYWIA